MARRTALLIATYDYEDAGLRRLTAPAHDADALAAVLEHPDIAGFDVTTLINEPHYRVGEAIADLYRERRRDDLTLLYFTGHGLKDDDGRLYLATANTRRDSLLFTSLPAEQIDQAMSGCMSRQNVLILDCCYSGAFPASGLTKADAEVHALERFRGRGRTVLTASDATQYSFEGDQPHGAAPQSVFTRHLVAGLRDGSADLDGDGDITLDELYSYVHERVVDERPQQRPKKQDNVEGRIVIARNVNWTLPAHLTHALASPIATDRLAALDGLDHLHRIGNHFVRRRITDEFRRLLEDDSRLVAAATRARLGEPLGSGASTAVDEAGIESREGPETESGAMSVPEPRSEPGAGEESAPAARPEPAPDPEPPPTQGHVARLRQDVAALRTHLWRRTRDRVRAVRLVDVIGLFPLLAAALLVTAAVLDVRSDYNHLSSGPDHDMLWYVTAMAAMALAAGVCTFLPRTRGLTGQGVTLGAAVGSIWGLVYFSLQKYDSSETTFRLVLAGHIALAVGACVTVYALVRSRAVSFELRRPGNPQTWIATGVGAVAAVLGSWALADELYRVAREYVIHGGTGYADLGAWPYLAAVVSAVWVPLWASVTAPRRFGLSLLAGWLGSACAIALVTYVRYGDSHLTVLFFGGTLLVLAAAAVFLARSSSSVGPVLLRRTVLIAALAGVPVLAAGGAVVADHHAHAPVREAEPWSLAFSPDGSRLYVTTALSGTGIKSGVYSDRPGQLMIIDTAKEKAIGRPLSLGKDLGGVTVAHGGDYAYVAAAASDSVIVVSGLENATVGKPVPVGDRPTQVTATSDGRRVLVFNAGSHDVSVIDTQTNTTTGPPIPLGKKLTGWAVDGDGRHIYVSHGDSGTLSVLDTETGKNTDNRGTIGFAPHDMAVSPNGRYLYAAGGKDPRDDGLTVIDTTTGRTTATGIPLDTGPHFGMALSSNGQRAYVANFFASTVSAIDTNTYAAVGQPIPVEGAPVAVAVSPDSRVVYVALQVTRKIAVFRSDSPGTVSYIDVTPR
ncbi:beta-propeller fold lactonase family protein [Streptomyces sp. NPDC059690]|uniref:caspase, EACC1-associated type n=1 Tax=Streptomyces sp. NPDC059690 TaxID=3346907 RepID=UPI0036A4BDB7